MQALSGGCACVMSSSRTGENKKLKLKTQNFPGYTRVYPGNFQGIRAYTRVYPQSHHCFRASNTNGFLSALAASMAYSKLYTIQVEYRNVLHSLLSKPCFFLASLLYFDLQSRILYLNGMSNVIKNKLPEKNGLVFTDLPNYYYILAL